MKQAKDKKTTLLRAIQLTLTGTNNDNFVSFFIIVLVQIVTDSTSRTAQQCADVNISVFAELETT